MDDTFARDGNRQQEETADNFRQASVALEAAYRRITSLRQNLLDLTDSIPSLDLQPGNSNTVGVGPPHEAILLSGSATEEQEGSSSLDMATLRLNLPPSVMERLEEFEAEFRPELLSNPSLEPIAPPPAPSGTTMRPLPPSTFSLNSPTIPHGNPLFPARRAFLESQYPSRRDSNPDDPSTVLGRRVAAREAGEVVNTSYASIPQLQQILLDSTTTIARNLAHLNHRLQQRVQNAESTIHSRPHSVPVHPSVNSDGRTRWGLQSNSGRVGSPGIILAQSSAPPNLFPARPQPNRRLRTVIRAEPGRQSSSGSPVMSPIATSGTGQPPTTGSRLSALSNFSTVDNLSTPITPLSHERPILFQEPDSYISQNNVGETPPEEPMERTYFIRRRVNADGEELVHNVNVFWNDPNEDSGPSISPWQSVDNIPSRRSTGGPVRPDRGSYHRSDTTQESRTPISRTPSRRRRGWARLDADGNEIPTDEEDQLERLRSENRQRSLHQSRNTTSSQTDAHPENMMAPTTGLSHTPVTRTTTAGELDATIALMQINRRVPWQSLTNALDSVISRERSRHFEWNSANSNTETLAPESSPEMFGSSLPFIVDPLPMPLMSMLPAVPSAKSNECAFVARVPQHASWAGR